ncbi:MAG TPA: tetratricopeptide repeat protein [Ramlibacter sp.]|nr:tetratricopeptide repeat protein [Ramlibacter sp.]
MNSTATPSTARLARLALLIDQDPGNPLLLADASQEAMAAGDYESAERYLQAGLRCDGANAAWRFRLASLKIAQRQLAEAKGLLSVLQAENPANPSIAHNLAYIELLASNYSVAAALLDPWIHGQVPSGPDTAAIQSLWLRAMHHADCLDEAWAWVEVRMRRGELSPSAAGVASLIALDRSALDDADRLSSSALHNDSSNVEALVVRGSLCMAKGDTAPAAEALRKAIEKAPHQARAWSTLGFVALLEMNPAQARTHLEKSLSLSPGDPGTLQALGWACVLLEDLDAAARAFEEAVKEAPDWGEAQGGLAVVQALRGHSTEAGARAQEARRLHRGSVSARYAEAILSGSPKGLKGIQRLANQILRNIGARQPGAAARKDADG